MLGLNNDLTYIIERMEPLLAELKGARILLTGGTGFFGKWLLLSLMGLIEHSGYNVQIEILSRSPTKFKASFPEVNAFSKQIRFIEGDVRSFVSPAAEFSHVIHAATAASADLNSNNPLEMFDIIVEGTHHVLNLCQSLKHKPQVLFISSGAVYGPQPSELSHIPETFKGSPEIYNTHSAYGIGKYTAEHLCYQYAEHHKISIKIARCFAFVGPYLPLDIHFAIGNFIRDGLKGDPIIVNGDGTPFRSYQYAADLVVWLLHILLRGQSCHPYNVGSDEDYDIAEIAHRVSLHFPNRPQVLIAKSRESHVSPSRYVPSIQRSLNELNLPPNLDLDTALKKTIDWYQQLGRN